MTQTLAIFVDAYRELNARKLFWITLLISGLVVAAFALIGVTESGVRLVVWDVDLFGINSTIMPPDVFYKSMFLNFGINIWLTWAAAILALVSTASIFPDFVSGGSIDLVLSKPIGRWRLFFTKYATGLLFVALQVSVFSAAAFLVIGLRGGVWEPGIFLAIPIVVVFFSYLFCVCVLLGIWTRSTIAALLLTVLFWFVIFLVHSTETTLLVFGEMKQQEVQRLEMRIEQQEQMLERVKASEAPADAVQRVQATINEQRDELTSARRTKGRLETFHRMSMAFKTGLPKTTETIGLLERSLIDVEPLQEAASNNRDLDWDRPDMEAVTADVVQTLRERSVSWIIGTSLIFEAIVVLLAGWMFVRRDF